MIWPNLLALALALLVCHTTILDIESLMFSLYSSAMEEAERHLNALSPPALAGLDEDTKSRLLYSLQSLNEERPKFFKLLTHHGLEFSQDLYRTTLFNAVTMEDSELTRLLMEHPFKQKASFLDYELSPYTTCFSAAVAKILLDYEVPIKDSKPVYHLMARGVTDVVEMMLARGCPIDLPSPGHPTLLQITINKIYPDAFEMLLQSGRATPFDLTSENTKLEDYIRNLNHFMSPFMRGLLRLYRLRRLWIEYVYPVFYYFNAKNPDMVDPFKHLITPLFLDNFSLIIEEN